MDVSTNLLNNDNLSTITQYINNNLDVWLRDGHRL